ncbi:efflux RND transporter periplasmic adaptor subunit [Limnobacter humi]|uniref:Efflux RND transporter periplasmic adaptor subunit n=1 Tax=Limnobacter humi TaxID=1778671 RepID=A0ABT1WGW0_9BURK|nr:efflux RND transporter periplasmic adaptor subunit [Limnobacter humi]MCQ8896757.1 efflux RND transporter periplasmic adaptor subunit [Limnobacter humi]
MKKNHAVIVVCLGVALVAGTAWWFGLQHGMSMAGSMREPSSTQSASADPSNWSIEQGEAATKRHMDAGLKAGDVDPDTGLKIQYYHDPMVPGKRFEAPGKSPFMDMMLVPAYQSTTGSDPGTVTVSPRIQQNLGIRTATVKRASLNPTVVAQGTVQWNERHRVVLQARATGFVEALGVKAAYDPVRAGQMLVQLYVPEWVAAQRDYLALLRAGSVADAALLDAARQRMRQVGLSPAQIASLVQRRDVMGTIPVVSPQAGVVTSLAVREGMTVQAGTTLAEINTLDSVWLDVELPQTQVGLIKPGSVATVLNPADPASEFPARVQAVLPQLNNQTRTAVVRLEVDNARRRLMPGQFVSARLAVDARQPAVLVPREAVIDTGQRTVVMLDLGDGHFAPQPVRLGLEEQGQVEVLSGLSEGQSVVLSGQFLIDSEASLRGLEDRLNASTGVQP